MRLLRLITWPYVRKHGLRTALTTAGILLGVSVFVGMHAANRSVLAAFNHTVDSIAGKTQLQVTAGEAGFSESLLDRVQEATTVGVAVPVIEAVVGTGLQGEGSLLVLGTDMTGDRRLRDYDLESGDDAVIDDPLVFLAQPDSVIVTADFAAAHGLSVNQQVPLLTALGPRQFTVRGIMKSSGLASAFGGNLAIMDIYAAQKMFGRGRTFDRIDIGVAEGHTEAEATAELQQRLGPGFQVESPASRGRHFEAMSAAYTMMVNISSVFALFIGMFIIYNAFAIAVTQRRSEIGILRALGATRAQIQRLFLMESAIAGAFGSAIGLGCGLLLSRAIAATIAHLMHDVYGVAEQATQVAADPVILLGALGLGILTSMVAAWIPAREAGAVDPVLALQKGRYQQLAGGERRGRGYAAAALVACAAACLAFGTSRPVFYVGYALMVLVSLLLAPVLSLGLAHVLRPVMKRIRPVEGALAADSLIQSPRRTAASVVAVMLSLALVIGFGGIAQSSRRSIVEWMDSALNPELFVSPSQDIVVRTLRFPATMGAELAAVPGVRLVQAVRNARVLYRGTPVMLVATDTVSLEHAVHRRFSAGDPATAWPAIQQGRGVFISNNLAELQHLRVGDLFELDAPYGSLRLPVAGVVIDYSDQQGSVLMDAQVFQTYWRDDTVNVFRVYLAEGTAVPDAKARILAGFSGERQLFVLTNPELKAYIMRVTDQWFGLSNVQIAVAVLVAVLGIVNTLTVSITDRRRELGVLQAVGGLRRQIRGTVWMEAVAISVIGLVLGLGLGAVNLYYTLQIVRHDIAGLQLDYLYPVGAALALVPTMLGSGFLAALWPAEAALRGSLVEALEYE